MAKAPPLPVPLGPLGEGLASVAGLGKGLAATGLDNALDATSPGLDVYGEDTAAGLLLTGLGESVGDRPRPSIAGLGEAATAAGEGNGCAAAGGGACAAGEGDACAAAGDGDACAAGESRVIAAGLEPPLLPGWQEKNSVLPLSDWQV